MYTNPIIRSLLDVDFYKFTMSQVFWLKHPKAHVTFRFTNRTKDRFAIENMIPMHGIMDELDRVRDMRFSPGQIAFLRAQGVFREDYLAALETLRLPKPDLRDVDGKYVIEATGDWWQATFWETIVLSIVNELYFRECVRAQSLACGTLEADLLERFRLEGVRRFRDKLHRLEAHPGVKVIEFGTRRRFSAEWQDYVTTAFSSKWPCGLPEQILGTSNVHLAKRLGIRPIGTFAHEAPMVYAAMHDYDDDALRMSHNLFLRDWWDTYGEPLSIALTDTFGSDFFFRDMTADQAAKWKGLRHDSGDPFAFAVKAIRFYEERGIDPKTKFIVFSDGLDVLKIISLYEAFRDRIGVSFGWGTNLTNDLGPKALSLVMKAVAVDGYPTVKLSDNPAKATGPAETVARYQRVFGHTESAYEECRY